jgi:hypothetical protein
MKTQVNDYWQWNNRPMIKFKILKIDNYGRAKIQYFHNNVITWVDIDNTFFKNHTSINYLKSPLWKAINENKNIF